MDGSEIRRMSLAGYNKQIKSLLISKQGKEAYQYIRDKREVTTRQVADHFDISIQHASTMLDKLYKQLYLRRDQLIQESGGHEWRYFL